MVKNQESKGRRNYFFGIIFGSLFISIFLLLVVYGLINWNRPTQYESSLVTAVITIIPLPSATQTEIPPTAEPTLSPNEPGIPPAGNFTIGVYVKINGTEGAGLRLRQSPGLDSEPLYLGLEDEIFKIEDGPVDLDGYIWWYLVAPFDSTRNGWGVSYYLQLVQDTN